MTEILTRSIPEQAVLAIRAAVPPALFPAFLGGAFGELYEFASIAELEPEGPPMARYHTMTPDVVDVEVCLPVPAGTVGTGRITAETLPAETVATTVHRGPYDTEGETYAALDHWIEAHDYVAHGPARERYLIGPDADVPPTEYRTEIEMPIEPARTTAAD